MTNGDNKNGNQWRKPHPHLCNLDMAGKPRKKN